MIFMVENLFYFILLFSSFIFSFLFSIYLVSFFIKIISKTSFLGKDMNKFDRPLVCELGGVPVFLSFILSILFVFLLNYLIIIIFNLNFSLINLIQFSLILLTLFLIFFLGFIDDILGWKKGISQIQHFLMPIIFSIPMIIYAFIFGISSIYLPLFGVFNVGLIYAFIFVPVALTATSNSLNLLAGYNGFEAGMAIIIFLTISIFSLFQKNFTLLIILFAWIGSLLGFLRFNKFPSKIFPGDIITLVNGAFIGVCAIVLRLELLIAFLIVLFIIEFIIKAKHRFKTECFGIILKDGTIKPNPRGGSLIHFVLNRGKFTEKKLVFTFYFIQGIISLVSLILFFIVYV